MIKGIEDLIIVVSSLCSSIFNKKIKKQDHYQNKKHKLTQKKKKIKK